MLFTNPTILKNMVLPKLKQLLVGMKMIRALKLWVISMNFTKQFLIVLLMTKYSHSMNIVLGEPVYMDRKECNGDPSEDCSIGLHCGCTSYVESFGNSCDVVLVCYVNPMNVISVPKSECSKMRVSEYYPIAVATYKDKKIDVVEQKYFEDDYREYELTELNELIAKVQAEELPIEAAINSEPETRSLEEIDRKSTR